MKVTAGSWERARSVVGRIFPAAILASLVAGGAAAARPSPAAVYLTAKGTGDRLAYRGRAAFRAVPQPGESSDTVVVDPTRRFQTIVGIGGALTDAAAETFFKLPVAQQAELIRAYFDPARGIGYTLARTSINSCDFSSESYAYDDRAGDTKLAAFSIAHDLRYRIPFIRRVLKAAPGLKIFASPWSPPAWMKDNHDMLHGGHLLPRYRGAWARYYIRFVQAYARAGVPIWGLTVQNEPMAAQAWESCLYTADQERDFVKGFLGPALARAGLSRVKLMIWDHNRSVMYQRAAAVLSDPEAAKYVWGTAFHWYVGDQFDTESAVHGAFPDKAILFSEGCNHPFGWDHIDDWQWGESYGRSMIGDFNHWTCGWTDWNVLLDERGGPNHVGNYCLAPVIVDTRKGTLHYMNAYYYLGHFSKFVHPGARRVACTTTRDDLLATAFLNPDGRVAAVVMNATDGDRAVDVWVAGKAAAVRMPPHSIATVVWR